LLADRVNPFVTADFSIQLAYDGLGVVIELRVQEPPTRGQLQPTDYLAELGRDGERLLPTRVATRGQAAPSVEQARVTPRRPRPLGQFPPPDSLAELGRDGERLLPTRVATVGQAAPSVEQARVTRRG